MVTNPCSRSILSLDPFPGSFPYTIVTESCKARSFVAFSKQLEWSLYYYSFLPVPSRSLKVSDLLITFVSLIKTSLG
jgi:hypothetical protein